MSDSRPLSDEELQRYVDGELPESRYLEITEQLEMDPQAARRVIEYREINRMLAGYNVDVLSEPVPRRLRGPRRPRLRGTALRAAAAIAFMGIGALVGYQMQSAFTPTVLGAPQQLVSNALAAHRVFANEVLHPVEVGAENLDHLEKWLGKRLDMTLKIPDIQDQGYRLLGGRLLTGDEESPHALVMYERGDGARMSLYIAKTAEDQEHTPFLFDEAGSLGVYSWIDEELSCAVVAHLDDTLDKDTLHNLSDLLYEKLEL